LDLLFFEDQIRNRLVVRQFDEKRLDESESLVDHLFVCQIDVSSNNGLGDVLGDFSFSLEPEILDQTRVLVHGQDDVGHGFERSGQELSDIHLAILINAGFVIGAVVGGITEDFVDVLMFVGIAFQGEL
jgi:hypothetical protein